MTTTRPTRYTDQRFELPSDLFVDECGNDRWARHAFSQRELRANAALGAVLDRRAWWIKCARRPDLQDAWRAEMEQELVRATVTHLAACWADREHYNYLGVVDKDRVQSTAEIPRLVRDVLYPPPEMYPFDDGGHCESDGDEDDEDIGEGDDTGDLIVPNGDPATDRVTRTTSIDLPDILLYHKTADSFLQILWYAKMELLRVCLRALPDAGWTKERISVIFDDIEGVDRDMVLRRVYALIEATRCAETVAAARALVLLHFPDERRQHVREILTLHLLKICRYVSKTLQNVESILRIAIDTLALRSNKPLARADTVYYVPGPVPRMWLSDNAVPSRLKAKLLRELAQLSSESDGEEERTTVRRLVDSAFHCAVVGETITVDTPIDRDSTVATHLDQTIFAEATGILKVERNHDTCRCKEPATYLRVPSELDVSHDGTRAVFRSYIHNLDPHDHAPLYKSLASLFTRFAPLFDQVVSTLDDSNYGVAHKGVAEPMLTAVLSDGGHEIRPSSAFERLVPPGLLEAANPRFTLKGSRCQVMVQIEEIALTPSNPRYAGEPWQLAGTDAERVLATGVYCAASKNVTAPRLSFRVPVEKPRFDRWDNVAIDVVYGLHDQLPLHQELGSVTLHEDRCLAYPSAYEHTTSSCELIDTTKPGSCTLVTFLLVDPLHASVASTARIPPPQDQWLKRALERALSRSTLPDLVVNHILSFLRLGKTHKQGLEARRRFVDERAEFLSKRVDDRIYQYRW